MTRATRQNCARAALLPCAVTGAFRTTPYGILATLSSPGRVHTYHGSILTTAWEEERGGASLFPQGRSQGGPSGVPLSDLFLSSDTWQDVNLRPPT
ncbi:hypothetical protein PGTUg99_005230 [Puccinia graminis f. sp. tritici]|uniref:Uncharacterized protein n=1 Tax=Puccinia graminis f. sp. tritici TaxID=56615 RepID=A0A5B0RQ35_PUCGR|nr:hypothetical protein PGTUg99_005230 [Puccinia graminis f. sp. tritici]